MNTQLRESFKSMRERVGLSQTQVADFLELDQSSISVFEKGERSIDLTSLEKSCSLFGCTLTDLQINNQDNCLEMNFRDTDLTKESLNQIAAINRIALNLIEMKELEAD